MKEDISNLAIEIAQKLPDLTDADLTHCITIFRLEQEGRAQAKKKAVAKTLAKLAEEAGLEITVNDAEIDANAGTAIAKKKTGPKPGTSPAVKYHNPATGEKWSGRGKKAKWLKALEGQGQDISIYLTDDFKEQEDQDNQ